MKRVAVKPFLLYCTLSKDEYDLIRPMIWTRNAKVLRITSAFAIVMGLLFFLANWIAHSKMLFPYLFLFGGSALIYGLLMLVEQHRPKEAHGVALCYSQMLILCIYAGILSTQQSNYAIPATSIIVFISLLPLTIDDRPLRMYVFTAAESALYLGVSYFLKSDGAFSLDVTNVLTFWVIGMSLYAVVCVRNVREIYQTVRLDKIQQSIITSLATVVEERDENTGDHIQRTTGYVTALTEAMRGRDEYADVTDEFYANVVLAAPLHDMGKIRIPDAILNKPGRLTDEEYALMKTHSALGERIIKKTMRDIDNEEYFSVACNIARHHHERYDGKGYPDGLVGEDIPLEARIMALADVYDALVSERVYKKAFSPQKAREIIREGAGTQFDPMLAELFLQIVP